MNEFDFMTSAIQLISKVETKQEYKEKMIDALFRIMASSVADSIVIAENNGPKRAEYGKE